MRTCASPLPGMRYHLLLSPRNALLVGMRMDKPFRNGTPCYCCTSRNALAKFSPSHQQGARVLRPPLTDHNSSNPPLSCRALPRTVRAQRPPRDAHTATGRSDHKRHRRPPRLPTKTRPTANNARFTCWRHIASLSPRMHSEKASVCVAPVPPPPPSCRTSASRGSKVRTPRGRARSPCRGAGVPALQAGCGGSRGCDARGPIVSLHL